MRSERRYHCPPNFKGVGSTTWDIGFIHKQLRFHNFMTGEILTPEQFAEVLPTLSPATQRYIEMFLRRNNILE